MPEFWKRAVPVSKVAGVDGAVAVTYQRLTDEGTSRIASAAAAISDAELFSGHALTARLERIE